MPHERHGVKNLSPIYWLFNSMPWLGIKCLQEWTICSLAISHWKRCQSTYIARANKCQRYRIFDYDMLFLFYIFHGVWLYTCVIICNWLMFGFVVREISFCSIVFDATWAPWRQKSESYLLVVQQHALARNKINIQTLSHWKSNLWNKLFVNFWDYPCHCVTLPFH